MHVIRHSERPELWKDTAAISHEVWPEYNLHSRPGRRRGNRGAYWEPNVWVVHDLRS